MEKHQSQVLDLCPGDIVMLRYREARDVLAAAVSAQLIQSLEQLLGRWAGWQGQGNADADTDADAIAKEIVDVDHGVGHGGVVQEERHCGRHGCSPEAAQLPTCSYLVYSAEQPQTDVPASYPKRARRGPGASLWVGES